MKRALIVSFTIIFTFVSCFIINATMSENMRVTGSKNTYKLNLVIDAGHGGIDVGTSGADSSREKDINLAIALKLYDFARVIGINSYLVRDGDYLVYKESDDRKHSDLYNRLDYVNSIYNPTLISIHQNHYENEKEWGMQIWYSPNDEYSKLLADKILNISKKYIQPENKRENKKSDESYYLLYKAKAPSIMVECGFMSNNKENKLLQDSKYQGKIAYSIVLGLSEYICEDI